MDRTVSQTTAGPALMVPAEYALVNVEMEPTVEVAATIEAVAQVAEATGWEVTHTDKLFSADTYSGRRMVDGRELELRIDPDGATVLVTLGTLNGD